MPRRLSIVHKCKNSSDRHRCGHKLYHCIIDCIYSNQSGQEEYIHLVENEIDQLHSIVAELEMLFDDEQVQENIIHLMNRSDLYLDYFHEGIEAHNELGFDQNSGMLQSITEARNEFIAAAKEQDEDQLLNAIYELFLDEQRILLQHLNRYSSQFFFIVNQSQQIHSQSDSFDTVIGYVDTSVDDIDLFLSEEFETIQAEKDELVARLYSNLLTTRAISILTLIMGSVWLTRSINASISRLEVGAAIIGAGHFYHRVDTKSTDEMALIAKHFNNMAERIQLPLLEVGKARQLNLRRVHKM